MTEALVGEARAPPYLLFGAVGILLRIALANVANLLLAQRRGRVKWRCGPRSEPVEPGSRANCSPTPPCSAWPEAGPPSGTNESD